MECKQLTELIRGDEGFGSSGIKVICMTTKDKIEKI
jgi:hypothetical protein